MPSNGPFADVQLGDLLKGDARAKEYANKVSKHYAESPQSIRNGSVHPALRPESTQVVLTDLDAGTSPPTTPTIRRTPTYPQNGPVDQIQATEDSFKAAMREYESTVPGKYKTGIDPDKNHTIQQLQEVVAHAVQKHSENDSKGLWGKVNAAFLKLGNNKESINSWLGLLPGESEYMSVVCGGFKLILEAAGRFSKINTDILEALQKIPTHLDAAERVLRIFPHSEHLKSLSKSFYASILSALGHILHYLGERAQSTRKRLKAIVMAGLDPCGFQETLVQKLEAIANDKEAFNDEAAICQKEMADDMKAGIDGLSERTGEELREMRKALSLYRAEHQRGIQSMGMKLGRQQSDIRRDVKFLRAAEEKRQMQPIALGHFNRVIQSGNVLHVHSSVMTMPLNTQYDPEQDAGRPVITISRRKEGSRPGRNRRRLLSMLDYDRNAVATDLVHLYKRGPTLPRDGQERSIYFIRSEKLGNWISATRSAALLVNGKSVSNERMSPLSFACARLVSALQRIRSPDGSAAPDRPDIIPLFFFCGQHWDAERSWESPSGVLNSLLAQLITQCRDLKLAKTLRMGRFDSGDVEDVFARFEGALAKVPWGTTVLCVVDGLSTYLDKDDRGVVEEAELLIRHFLDLVRSKSRKRHYTFKFLLTATGRLHSTEAEMTDDEERMEVLSIPECLPYTGGFTEMRWHLNAEEQLESIANSG